MTDPQGQPDHEPAAAPEPTAPAEPIPPAAAEPATPAQPADGDRPADPPAKKAAKKAPAKAAKKAPAKPAKKAPAKKAPAKKAPSKQSPAAEAPPTVPSLSPRAADTNGSGPLADGAKQTAAQAKSTVEAARNPLTPSAAPSRRSPGAVLAAGVLGLFGLLLLRRLLRASRG